MSDPILLIDALSHPNVQAFLKVIRAGEGTLGEDGYRTMFGGALFDSFDDHPRQLHTFKLKKGGELSSTAAGAFQFLSRTWDEIAKQYGFRNFMPSTQDMGAVALLVRRKALDDVIAGRFEDAVRKCAREWASLPGSPYGQPTKTMEQAIAVYTEHGGEFA